MHLCTHELTQVYISYVAFTSLLAAAQARMLQAALTAEHA